MSQPSAERRAIERLLTERGLVRHALFLTQQEGLWLPGDLEVVSGFALAPDGRVFGFWLAWDSAQDTLTLDPFYPVKNPSAAFARDREYRRARQQLGLASPRIRVRRSET